MKIHIPVYNCKLLLFCYFVFWIPTIQDTIFILNRNGTTNGFVELLFSRRSQEIKETFRVHVEHNTMTVYPFEHLQDKLWHIFEFFLFITTLPREAITSRTHWDWSQQRRKTIKQTWRMYINIHFLFNCDQKNTMKTGSKKIFTSVFVMLLPLYHNPTQSAVFSDNCDSFTAVPIKSPSANMIHLSKGPFNFLRRSDGRFLCVHIKNPPKIQAVFPPHSKPLTVRFRSETLESSSKVTLDQNGWDKWSVALALCWWKG